MIRKERAGLEIPVRYRHRETGIQIETMIANFWTFEDGWPVGLSEAEQAFATRLWEHHGVRLVVRRQVPFGWG